MSNEELLAMYENDGKDPDEGLTWSSRKSEPEGCLLIDWPHCQKYMDEPWFISECYLDMTERFFDPAYWIPVSRIKEYADDNQRKV